MQSVKHLKPEDQIRAMSLFEGQEDFKPFHIKEEDEKKSDKKQEAVKHEVRKLNRSLISYFWVYRLVVPWIST